MAFGGTPDEHCGRAKEYVDDLMWDIRTFRNMVRNARSASEKVDHARTGIFNVDSRLSALGAEMRWLDNECYPRVQAAVKTANKFKGDMFEIRGTNLGFLPEFGNVWPMYLAAGSIALWLWKSKKA